MPLRSSRNTCDRLACHRCARRQGAPRSVLGSGAPVLGVKSRTAETGHCRSNWGLRIPPGDGNNVDGKRQKTGRHVSNHSSTGGIDRRSLLAAAARAEKENSKAQRQSSSVPASRSDLCRHTVHPLQRHPAGLPGTRAEDGNSAGAPVPAHRSLRLRCVFCRRGAHCARAARSGACRPLLASDRRIVAPDPASAVRVLSTVSTVSVVVAHSRGSN